MSSIFGFWDINRHPVEEKAFQFIAQKTNWWNADSTDILHKNNIGFGIAALDNNPTENPNVYTHAETKTIIVADVRLDNRVALIQLLKLDKRAPDSLILLHAYLKFGTKALPHIKGDFAFVIWDDRKKQIFAGRDQIGIKPFNYYFKDNIFIFGTQKKSILHFPNLTFKMDWDYIVQRVEERKFKPYDTEYLHIKRLQPAHFLVINQNGITKEKYWELATNKPVRYKNEADYVDHFLELFEEAVKVRMKTKKQLGTHVSGGFDSSAIATIAQKISKQQETKLHGLAYTRPKETIEHENDRIDESDYVDDILSHTGIATCHKVNTVINRTQKEEINYESLICDGFQIGNKVNNEYEILLKAQKNNISTILSGFPGDELISYHYYNYVYDYLDQGKYWAYFTDKNSSSIKHRLKYLFFRILQNNTFTKSLRRIINNKKRNNIIAAFSKSEYLLNTKLSNSISNAVFKNTNFDYFSEIYNSSVAHQKHKITYWPVSYRMESEHLVGLKFKVDYVYPLSDLSLLEYTINLPHEQRWDGKVNRLFFKNVCKQILPLDFVNKEKTKGVIKPMLKYYKKPKEDSIIELWEELKSNQLVDFLDHEKAEQIFNKKLSRLKLSKYLLIGNLNQRFNLDFS